MIYCIDVKKYLICKKEVYLVLNMFIYDKCYFGIKKFLMNGRKIYFILIKIWIM